VSQELVVALFGVGGSILGTGGLLGLLNARMKIGAAKEKSEIERLRLDIAEFRSELSACEARHVVLETRLKAVEFDNAIFLARWKKDATKRLIWISDKAFLMIFAPLGYASRDDLQGHTFAELLGDVEAIREIDLLDQIALAQPRSVVSNLINLQPGGPPTMVLKVATMVDDELVYEGYAYQASHPDLLIAAGKARQARQIEASTTHLLKDKLDDTL